jgi:hypothetical protein
MSKEFDFKVIDKATIDEFETEVKRLLASGYELHGNMTALQDHNGDIHYIQAVVKDISERRSTGFMIGK